MERIPAVPSPRLEVRDLRVALALASAGTTSRAAALLHLTQPAVSRALLAVEDKLGVKLFDRSPRGLTPTPAGHAFVAEAAQLLAMLGDLERRVGAPEAPVTRIRVVCECYTAYHWLPSALLGLRASLPGLEVRLAVEHTREPVAALVAGDVDVALITASPVPHGDLEERPLFSDEIIFVLAADHPLAAKKTLTRADLRATTLLSVHSPPAETQWFLTRVFGRARPRLSFQRLPLTEAILDVARAGMGVAIMSEWIAGPHLVGGDLVAKRLAAGPLRRPWRLAWRRDVRDAARRLHAAFEATAPRAALGLAPG